MNWSRRDFVLAGLSLVAAGCSNQSKGLLSSAPPPLLRAPDDPMRMPRVARPAPVPTTIAPRPAPAAGSVLRVIPRKTWANNTPIPARLNLMGSVTRITIHHEGCPEPVEFADVRSTATRLEKIRTVHVRDRHWGDIGYHFVVDRAGRIWEARPLQYQGAHVKHNNEHNIGIMLMGNFDRQRPTEAQIASLRNTVVGLRRQHMVSMRHIQTHQEINPTRCPGSYLQRQIVSLRSNGLLV